MSQQNTEKKYELYNIFFSNFNTEKLLNLFEDPTKLSSKTIDQIALETLYENIIKRLTPEQKKLLEYQINKNMLFYSSPGTYSFRDKFPSLNDNEISYAIKFANIVIERKHYLEKILKTKTLIELQNYYNQLSKLVVIFYLPTKEILDCLSKSRLYNIFHLLNSYDLKLLAKSLHLPKVQLYNLINLLRKNELNKTESKIVNYFISIFNQKELNHHTNEAIVLTFIETFEKFPFLLYNLDNIKSIFSSDYSYYIELKNKLKSISHCFNLKLFDGSKEEFEILICYIKELFDKNYFSKSEKELLISIKCIIKTNNPKLQDNKSYANFFANLKSNSVILDIISFIKRLSTFDNNEIKSFIENPALLKNIFGNIDFLEKLRIFRDFILSPELKNYVQNHINSNEKINIYQVIYQFNLKSNNIALFYLNKINEQINNLKEYLANMNINELETLFYDTTKIKELSEKFFVLFEDVQKNICNSIFNYENKENISNKFKEGFEINLFNDYPKLEPVDKSQETSK